MLVLVFCDGAQRYDENEYECLRDVHDHLGGFRSPWHLAGGDRIRRRFGSALAALSKGDGTPTARTACSLARHG